MKRNLALSFALLLWLPVSAPGLKVRYEKKACIFFIAPAINADFGIQTATAKPIHQAIAVGTIRPATKVRHRPHTDVGAELTLIENNSSSAPANTLF